MKVFDHGVSWHRHFMRGGRHAGDRGQRRRRICDLLAAWIYEDDQTAFVALHAVAVFMDEAVVPTALCRVLDYAAYAVGSPCSAGRMHFERGIIRAPPGKPRVDRAGGSADA